MAKRYQTYIHHFLATGETFRSLSFQFRISRAAISYIVQEVCQAIEKRLAPKFLAFPSQKHPTSIYSLPIGRSSGQFPRRSNVLLFVLVFFLLEVWSIFCAASSLADIFKLHWREQTVSIVTAEFAVLMRVRACNQTNKISRIQHENKRNVGWCWIKCLILHQTCSNIIQHVEWSSNTVAKR